MPVANISCAIGDVVAISCISRLLFRRMEPDSYRDLVINLTSLPGGRQEFRAVPQLGNSLTAQSPGALAVILMKYYKNS